jgi:lambda repressor-like predicted transcriptional regulator
MQMAVVYNETFDRNSFSENRLVRHQQIRQALKDRRRTISSVARELGVSPATVTTVSQGYRRSAKIEQHIAMLLGTSVSDLFPELYPKGGSR